MSSVQVAAHARPQTLRDAGHSQCPRSPQACREDHLGGSSFEPELGSAYFQRRCFWSSAMNSLANVSAFSVVQRTEESGSISLTAMEAP